ncbi:MAG: aldehyde dehydrogenase [Bacteroidota bacterium]|nr:aldehyde dehydrogenase [Bacteroidota bacterium]
MEIEKADQLFNAQRNFFDEGKTKSYDFRVQQLKKLRTAIEKNEENIIGALHADMHKPRFEAFVSEIGIIYEEIDHVLDHLKKWMKPERVPTPLSLQISTSRIYTEPLGVVLIIGPWNYPFQLLIAPLIGSIAAGNCAILKPSDNTKNIASLIEKIIAETFDENYIAVVTGAGSVVGPQLIEKYRFDHIFFTGSPGIGKEIMKMAAAHLTPVTLELGGKSPAIVDRNLDLKVTAKRLVWAKFFNAGQTCVGPDYLLVHESVKEELIKQMILAIKEFYGEDPLNSENLTHIINSKRFGILHSYLGGLNIVYGGKSDEKTLCMEPTIVDGVTMDHPIMQEEIFGPILPVFTYREMEEILPFIRKHRYPLACYLFTTDQVTEDFVIRNIEFGGGCINNALAHLANPHLPFGGIGNSGMGSYHGKKSFDAFSHKKSVMKSKLFFDPPIKYPPYTESKEKWARFFFK